MPEASLGERALALGGHPRSLTEVFVENAPDWRAEDCGKRKKGSGRLANKKNARKIRNIADLQGRKRSFTERDINIGLGGQ